MTRHLLSVLYSGLILVTLLSVSSTAFQSPLQSSSLRSESSSKSLPSYPSTTLLAPKMATTSSTEDSSSSPNEEKSFLRTVLHSIGASTSIVVSGTFFLALAYQRDALMVSFFIGSIANAITGKILKRILNQERPAELETVEMKLKPGDKGMPSSHAMSLGFIGVFTGLTLPWTQIPIAVYSLISLAYRIDIKLHTWQQIAVGFVVGATNGALWKHLCDGTNPWGIHIMDVLQQTGILNEQGLLPLALLVIPAIVGAIVVGSVERRLAGWIQKVKGE